jgi:uncharacterized protein YndB with AHSA1/START domain
MNNWNEFTVRGSFKASVEEVYKRWATQEGIESWFLRSSVFKTPAGQERARTGFAQADDTFAWLWHGYDDDVVEHRKVLAANGKDFFEFTFTGDCVVSVSIYPKGEITIVELKQDLIPDDDNSETNLFVHCQIGWTFYLANLKSVLEGGVDLRNKNPELLTNFK